ncbi:hypothetical protein [Amycolatopsis sp. WAC 01375]|uniref:hypothetical protein n=1 Tax=Amycolatopsis sp. WAC 01375 TaxID=2203194 RepID=UPI0018F4BEF8|nr:hypothetical protein [Amycolatopsis sp. WAC 01375]
MASAGGQRLAWLLLLTSLAVGVALVRAADAWTGRGPPRSADRVGSPEATERSEARLTRSARSCGHRAQPGAGGPECAAATGGGRASAGRGQFAMAGRSRQRGIMMRLLRSDIPSGSIDQLNCEDQAMRRTTAPIYSKSGDVLGHLDLTDAHWQGGEDVADGVEVVEVAFVQHTDGVIYTAVRRTPPLTDEDLVMTYTPTEWKLFAAQASTGYFDPEAVMERHRNREHGGSATA